MSRIKELLRLLISFIPGLQWFLQFENNNRNQLIRGGIKEKLWAFRKGFFLETIKLCGITKENFHEYLSDKTYLKLHPINKQYSQIIDNKLYLPFLLKDYPDLVPKYYFLIDKGRLVKIDLERSVDQGLLQLCKEKHRLVLKHCSSSLGKGFYLLEWKLNSFFLNNKAIEPSELNSFIESLDRYLVTEYINQHKYASDINKNSINTVRLLCVRDIEKNEFFIPRSFHRFGIKGNIVDNLGSEFGGLLALIDIETGKIKDRGLIKEKGKAEEKIIISKHPDSQVPIAKVKIPNWFGIIKTVLVMMDHLSFLKYVGLDIVITENGFKIIEMNSLPSLSGIQIEEGLLKDNRLKRFFFS